jgi:predicted HAD superfamily Cof-like phosphohydrolase
MKKKGKKRWRNPEPGWLMRRLAKKESYLTDEAAVVMGIDPKNVLELMRRGRLTPISGPPYRFAASDIRNFTRLKPGRKKVEKVVEPKPKKRFYKKPLKSRGSKSRKGGR